MVSFLFVTVSFRSRSSDPSIHSSHKGWIFIQIHYISTLI